MKKHLFQDKENLNYLDMADCCIAVLLYHFRDTKFHQRQDLDCHNFLYDIVYLHHRDASNQKMMSSFPSYRVCSLQCIRMNVSFEFFFYIYVE